MFLNVVNGSSEKSVKTQAIGPISVARDYSLLFLRLAPWLRRLAARIAPYAEDRIIDRRLRTSRWCDSTERALLDDLTGPRRNS
jgi:hypothetical protein